MSGFAALSERVCYSGSSLHVFGLLFTMQWSRDVCIRCVNCQDAKSVNALTNGKNYFVEAGLILVDIRRLMLNFESIFFHVV